MKKYSKVTIKQVMNAMEFMKPLSSKVDVKIEMKKKNVDKTKKNGVSSVSRK